MNHACIAGCSQVVPDSMLLCKPHWALVSRGQQREVIDSYRARLGGGSTGRHWAAVLNALREAAEYATLITESGVDVSAITLVQPFASAMVLGPKRVENRDWRIAVPAGGRWLAIHAGLNTRRDQLAPMKLLWPDMPSELPTGVVVGLVHLGRRLDIETAEGAEYAADDPFAFGRYLHIGDDAVPFGEPRPVSGARQLWRLPVADYRACVELLRETGRIP